jgi:CheY-like chemotaxis protein
LALTRPFILWVSVGVGSVGSTNTSTSCIAGVVANKNNRLIYLRSLPLLAIRRNMRFKKPCVLCADDNEFVRDFLTTLLSISGVDVKPVNTATMAWRLAQIEQFDLYVLETQFPDGDGFELCKKIRKVAPNTPVLFYSVHANGKQKGIEAGADAYLVKPDSHNLANTVLQLISKARGGAEMVKD